VRRAGRAREWAKAHRKKKKDAEQLGQKKVLQLEEQVRNLLASQATGRTAVEPISSTSCADKPAHRQHPLHQGYDVEPAKTDAVHGMQIATTHVQEMASETCAAKDIQIFSSPRLRDERLTRKATSSAGGTSDCIQEAQWR
jgi:hypothetical protein